MIHVVYLLAIGALIACFHRLASRVKELEQTATAEMLADPAVPASDPYGADIESCRKACAELRTDIRALRADGERLGQADAALDRRVDKIEKTLDGLPAMVATQATNAVSSTLYRLATSVKDPV